jgi:hypothetical protein
MQSDMPPNEYYKLFKPDYSSFTPPLPHPHTPAHTSALASPCFANKHTVEAASEQPDMPQRLHLMLNSC